MGDGRGLRDGARPLDVLIIIRISWAFWCPRNALVLTVVDEERYAWIGGYVGRLAGCGVCGHDDDGSGRVWRGREICIVHERHLGHIVCTCRKM